MVQNSAIKPLVFVLCPAFHGATLFSLLLNNHSRISTLGDTLPFREHLDYFCSCKQRINECEFWTILADELEASRFVSDDYLLPMLPRLTRHKQFNFLQNVGLIRAASMIGRFAWFSRYSPAKEFLDIFLRLENLVCDMQKTDLYVDGTKSRHRFCVLRSMLPSRPAKVLHLIRDPRGYAHSYKKNIKSSGTLGQIAQGWNNYHRKVEIDCNRFDRIDYLQIRYEDLALSPQMEMDRVFQFLDLDKEEVVAAPRFPQKNHLIGNEMLLSFDGTVKLSERWESDLSPRMKLEVLEMAEPLAEKFGYR